MSTAESTAVRKNLYEGMFLIESGRFASDPDGSTEAIMAVLERAGAEVVAHRPWQDGKLAYPIQDQRKGTHYLVCFKMEGDGMGVLNRQAQLSDAILRHMVIRHTPELFEAVVGAITGTAPDEASEEVAVKPKATADSDKGDSDKGDSDKGDSDKGDSDNGDD